MGLTTLTTGQKAQTIDEWSEKILVSKLSDTSDTMNIFGKSAQCL
jgi:hypothetical protein